MNDTDRLVPARMINEWVYCPRLAYLEWVDGEWADSADTVDGRRVHARVDARDDSLPGPEEIPAEGEVIGRGVTLSSLDDGIIAKLDLVELRESGAHPVDYKRGERPDHPDGAWPPERAQIAAQALVLRSSGYPCDDGSLYFAASKRRVTVPIDDALIETVRDAADALRRARADRRCPAPLVDSPKCTGCSLAPICLPDELIALTRPASAHDTEANGEVESDEDTMRRLMPARDDAIPLHVGHQGAVIGKRGEELIVKYRGGELARARLPGTSTVALYGNVTVTTPATRALMRHAIPIAYHSMGGWFDGIAHAWPRHALDHRRAQYRAADDPRARLAVAQRIVRVKIINQRALLRRNHPDPPADTIREMKALARRAASAPTVDMLRGFEGHAAALYFGQFGALIRPPGDDPQLDFTWTHRNRRPPTDPINAMLSFTYALLTREWSTMIQRVGLDPMLGYLHEPRAGRPALALDLMEEFRPVLADSVVLTAVNNGEVTPRHFITVGPACNLDATGRKKVLQTWERRLDALVTHPVFGYRISYRRTLEVQARLFARHLAGEIPHYPDFTIR